MEYACFPLDTGYLPVTISMAFLRKSMIFQVQKIFYVSLCLYKLSCCIRNIRTFHLDQANYFVLIFIPCIKNKPITAWIIRLQAETMRYSPFCIAAIIKLEA